MELLAPAGSVESLHAAVNAGADAVYLGLDAFNARRNADNFTLENLGEACDFAHLRGVSVYITMNTIIFPDEFADALEYARQAYRIGADAFIVQDIGLAAELTRTLPDARLHISTQMNTMNLAGIRAAHRLGAKRVTLARELSIDEVAACCDEASALGMEVETFVHGALCICASGQCYMSSMIGGRSANRGLCAQPCRLPYGLRNTSTSKILDAPGEHLLSPKDLCAGDLLPDLVAAGVESFKIEGRMKSPEYVGAVVGVYRAALDRVAADRTASTAPAAALTAAGKPLLTDAERHTLDEAFSRGFTEGYLVGERGNDLMGYKRPNNRGVSLGKVVSSDGDTLTFKANRDVSEGDVLEVWTGKGNVTVPVRGLKKLGGGRLSCALPPQARAVRSGDRVFRVRNEAASDAALPESPLDPRIPVRGRAELRIGHPLRIAFAVDTDSAAAARPAEAAIARRLNARFHGDVPEGAAAGAEVEAARTKAVTREDVVAHIDRLGQSPYRLTALEVELDDGVGIGFSALHHVRAEALDSLTDALLAGTRRRALPRVTERDRQPLPEIGGTHIAAWATNPVCARAAKRAGADILYVPALNFARGASVIAGQATGLEQAGYPKHCAIALPVEDHEPVGSSREALVGFDPWAYALDAQAVLADSLGAMERADEEGLVFDVGAHVPIVNGDALDVAAQFGARRVWLSPELTITQIRELGRRRSVELGLTVIGSQELMVTEHCMLMSQGPCNQHCAECARRKSPHVLKDRKGYEFPVITDILGRSHLYNSVQLDIAHAMPELLAAGVTSFMVDTTLMNGEQAAQAVGRVARALKVALSDGNAIAKMPDTTTGHVFRGVA